jgi:phenol 2-monooxygenase
VQFHLDGFRTGDPSLSGLAAAPEPSQGVRALPAEVDVLIVGCGPAGLTLAAQLAAFRGIKTCIIEQKSGPLSLGQADGVACRTMEMFEAFGFSERVLKEAYWVNETAFWKPDDRNRAHIARSGRIRDTEEGLSEFPHVILNQARVHDFYLDVMRNGPARLEPDYSRRLLKLEISGGEDGRDASAHPVTVTLERLDPAHEGQIETVRARYVAGCDGARSAVRNSLGRALEGDSANQAWGVMDVLAVTDFPDIRLKTAIKSAEEGSLLIIPREGGYLARLYVELDRLGAGERAANLNVTTGRLIAAAQRILRPYTLEVKEIAWWSVYEIGQRLCDRFDDLPGAADRSPRVFIVGDACHTHSPKAGQGMNVAMQDAFNLGWKLASVLRGQSSPRILNTYSGERHAVAKELIDFDRKWAKMFGARAKDPSDESAEGVDPIEFQTYFVKQARFTAGTETHYAPSIISAEPRYQHLAEGFPIGMRFHSAPVIRLADAKPMQLGHTVRADGRWRLFAFAGAGDPGALSSPLRKLCEFLAASALSPVRRYTPDGADIDSVIDVRAVFQRSHRELAIEAMPAFLLPAKGRHGLRDYEKMFCADLGNGEGIFDMRRIDRERGCLVVVRPDQYVAHVLPFDAHAELGEFFDGFMVRAK